MGATSASLQKRWQSIDCLWVSGSFNQSRPCILKSSSKWRWKDLSKHFDSSERGQSRAQSFSCMRAKWRSRTYIILFSMTQQHVKTYLLAFQFIDMFVLKPEYCWKTSLHSCMRLAEILTAQIRWKKAEWINSWPLDWTIFQTTTQTSRKRLLKNVKK